MVYVSTYLYLLQFFSSVSYNLPNTGLLPARLNLFLGILFYFISDAIVNGIVSLVSLSGSSLLVYKEATNFCIFILHPAILLNLFIRSSSFFVESLGFSIYSTSSVVYVFYMDIM